jgi:hypothetical protein
MSHTAPERRRAIERLHAHAGADWREITDAHEAGKQGVRMEAALRLVLAFHSGEPWTRERQLDWHNLQVEAGVEHPHPATTKGLCDVIRDVLGIEPEARP